MGNSTSAHSAASRSRRRRLKARYPPVEAHTTGGLLTIQAQGQQAGFGLGESFAADLAAFAVLGVTACVLFGLLLAALTNKRFGSAASIGAGAGATSATVAALARWWRPSTADLTLTFSVLGFCLLVCLIFYIIYQNHSNGSGT